MKKLEPHNVRNLNPDPTDPAVDIKKVPGKMVYVKRNYNHKRELRHLRNKETAAKSIDGLTKDVEIFGFTKGQFSLIDLIAAVLDITGPAELTVSTWTAANYDISKVLEFLDQGKVTGSRWLVDLTFQRRAPELANRIRKTFGIDAIRVAQTHAKFSLIQNHDWRIVIRTSMNLNTNPRFEDFTIAHDPELADFLQDIVAKIWQRQPKELAYAKTKEQQHFFRDLM